MEVIIALVMMWLIKQSCIKTTTWLPSLSLIDCLIDWLRLVRLVRLNSFGVALTFLESPLVLMAGWSMCQSQRRKTARLLWCRNSRKVGKPFNHTIHLNSHWHLDYCYSYYIMKVCLLLYINLCKYHHGTSWTSCMIISVQTSTCVMKCSQRHQFSP